MATSPHFQLFHQKVNELTNASTIAEATKIRDDLVDQIEEFYCSICQKISPISEKKGDCMPFQWGVIAWCSKPTILSKPEIVPVDKQITQISCGYNYCGGITSTGELLTWGIGRNFRLGHGDEVSRDHPTPVQALSSVIVYQVSCGLAHTLLIAEANQGLIGHRVVWAFGSNSHGQLGIGLFPTELSVIEAPQILDEGFNENTEIVSISAGYFHSGAIDSGGEIWMWGSTEAGRLGGAERNAEIQDSKVATPSRLCFERSLESFDQNSCEEAPKFRALVCGSRSNIAISINGRVFTWGQGDYYTIGAASSTNRLFPMQISSLAEPIVSVGVGSHIAAAVSTQGKVWIWGISVVRALADKQSSRMSDLQDEACKDIDGDKGKTPLSIQFFDEFDFQVKQVVCNDRNAYFLCSNNSIWVLGDANSGKLGVGKSAQEFFLSPVRVESFIAKDENAKCFNSRIPESKRKKKKFVPIAISAANNYAMVLCVPQNKQNVDILQPNKYQNDSEHKSDHSVLAMPWPNPNCQWNSDESKSDQNQSNDILTVDFTTGQNGPWVLHQIMHWAIQRPHVSAITWIADTGPCLPSESLTYRDLWSQVCGLACDLSTNHSLEPGDRVILAFEHGPSFILSFLACMHSGLVPVPIASPFSRPNPARNVIHACSEIILDCIPRLGLTDSTIVNQEPMHTFGIEWIVVGFSNMNHQHREPSSVNCSSVAFLQYTSGSTGNPKGVCITHSNLEHNLGTLANRGNINTSTILVSWLPHYHDMGLILAYLCVLCSGACGIYMSPRRFLTNPIDWLNTISASRATHTQAPNFAFDLVVNRWRAFLQTQSDLESKSISEDQSVIDLSCLCHVGIAAEPILANTLINFADTFRSIGFTSSAYHPSYGLAEHTVYASSGGESIIIVNAESLQRHCHVDILKEISLANISSESLVSTNSTGESDSNSTMTLKLVSCGRVDLDAAHGIQICIMDQNNCPQPNCCIGEVWLCSASVANGYWNNEKSTSDVFLEEDIGEAPSELQVSSKNKWLKTGDLGFIYANQLWICGRKKDVLIVKGRNVMPQDVEKCAENASSKYLRPGCSAVFQIYLPSSASPGIEHSEQSGVIFGSIDKDNFENEGRIVLLCEIRQNRSINAENAQRIFQTVSDAIAKDCGISIYEIVLLQSSSIFKTTSGKIQRSRCREAYKNGNLIGVLFSSSDLNSKLVCNDTPAVDGVSVAVEEDSIRRFIALRRKLEHILEDEIGIDMSEFHPRQNLMEMGIGSVGMVQLQERTNREFGIRIPLAFFLHHQTLEDAAIHLLPLLPRGIGLF